MSASKAGLVRIERLLSPFQAPVMVLLVQPHTYSADPCPKKKEMVSTWIFFYSIGRDAQKEEAYFESDDGVQYSSASGISVCRIEMPLKAVRNYGIGSYLDLPGKKIALSLFDLDARMYIINSLKIKTKDGQGIDIPLEKAIVKAADVEESNEQAWGVTYAFPAGRDPRSTSDYYRPLRLNDGP